MHTTSKTELVAYTAIIWLVLEYAVAVWDPHTKKDTILTEKMRYKALRLVYNAGGRKASVTNLHMQSEMPLLESHRKHHRLQLLLTIVTSQTKLDFHSYMQLNNTRQTRGKQENIINAPNENQGLSLLFLSANDIKMKFIATRGDPSDVTSISFIGRVHHGLIRFLAHYLMRK